MSKQRVYTFSSNAVEELDQKINDFIKSQKGTTVISISHSSCPACSKETELSFGLINYSVSLLLKYNKQ